MNDTHKQMMKLPPRKWTPAMWIIATEMAAFFLAALVAQHKGEV